jgi:hypothetical protein
LLGDVIFSHPYYLFPSGLLFYKIEQNKSFCFGLWAEGNKRGEWPKTKISYL